MVDFFSKPHYHQPQSNNLPFRNVLAKIVRPVHQGHLINLVEAHEDKVIVEPEISNYHKPSEGRLNEQKVPPDFFRIYMKAKILLHKCSYPFLVLFHNDI